MGNGHRLGTSYSVLGTSYLVLGTSYVDMLAKCDCHRRQFDRYFVKRHCIGRPRRSRQRCVENGGPFEPAVGERQGWADTACDRLDHLPFRQLPAIAQTSFERAERRQLVASPLPSVLTAASGDGIEQVI